MSLIYKLVKRASDECKNKDSLSQQCEKPSILSGAELAVTICIPIIVVGAVLGGLAFRAYKVNKREEKEFQNDPEFYKNYDEYISTNEMPIYPPPAYKNNHSMINNDSSENVRSSNSYPASVAGSNINPFNTRDDRYPPSGAGSVPGSLVNLNDRKFT